MDRKRLKSLKRMVKTSLILLPEEKEYWLENIPTMKEAELNELEDIVNTAAGIDWQKELPQYEQIIQQSVLLIETATVELRSLTPA